MKHGLLTALFWLLAWCITAQELPANTRQQLEHLAEVLDASPEDDALLQQLHFWQKHPLNLNTADADDLQVFPFLSALQISRFLQYRSMLGPLVDLHELQCVPTWDLETIREILPFVQVLPQVSPLRTIGQRLKGGEHQLLLRSGRVLQRAAGFSNSGGSRFAGDPYHAFLRYQYRHAGGVQWGITAEKDAGEAMGKIGKSTPDFLSAHFFLRQAGRIKAIAVGDFSVNLGQGLVHWQSLAFGKGPAVLNIKRQAPVLRPYAAAGEALFLRGAGTTVALGRWEATFFAAKQKIHANTDLNEQGETIITSFSPGGLHRTSSELAQRKSAGQQVLGGNLQYRSESFFLGFNAVNYRFDIPVEKRDEPYNLFALKGSNFLNFSTDYSFTWRNLHLFGELAASEQAKPALVQGLIMSVHPRLDLALQGRFFHRAYTAISANAFSENGNPFNETGIYSGMQLRAHQQITLSAYADVFRLPWLRFQVNAPSTGSDYLVQAMYQPSRKTELYIRFRAEQKERNRTDEENRIAVPHNYLRQNLRLHIGQVLSNWTLRSRAEAVWFQSKPGVKKETGFLWYGEVQYRGKQKFDGTARLAFFETAGYNSRLYAYETDVLYGYAIPALFGKGQRSYLTLHYRITQKVGIWARLAYNFYPEQQSIGTGLSKIDGNRRTEVRFQLAARL